jgi:hypothetical protein
LPEAIGPAAAAVERRMPAGGRPGAADNNRRINIPARDGKSCARQLKGSLAESI